MNLHYLKAASGSLLPAVLLLAFCTGATANEGKPNILVLWGDNAGNDLPNAPTHKISANARYEMNQCLASVSLNRVSDSFSDTANTKRETANGDAGELPHYTLVNARTGPDISLSEDTLLNAGLSATHLLDDDTCFRGTDVSPMGRVPMPGRAYMLETRLDF